MTMKSAVRRKSDRERVTIHVAVKMTPDEHAQITRVAASELMSTSTWARRTLVREASRSPAGVQASEVL
jgi:hypothetical protein